VLTREVAVFVCAFAFLIGLFAAVGLVWWSLLWVLIGASLALVEYLVWSKTGKTLSEQFGQLCGVGSKKGGERGDFRLYARLPA
jgi:hypothetical protein